MAQMHKVALSPDILERVRKRRGGKLHAYDRFEGGRTALLVVDMQNVWVKEGMPAYSPYCQAIVPNINRLAAATRSAGGQVYWIRAIYEDAPKTWSAYMEFMDDRQTREMLDCLSEGHEGSALWRDLDVQPKDEMVVKRRFGAFVRGSSDLEDRLRARGLDTLLITGTATNVCCESTARDAFMLNFRTTVISDANAAATDELHNASLNLLFARFADVMTTDEAIARLGARAAAAAE